MSLQKPESKLKRNIYSRDLLKIIYIDSDLSSLCETDESPENTDSVPNSAAGVAATTSGLPNAASVMSMGARCLKINPHGSQMATGDRNGNIRIYDLNSLESVCMIEAHDGEVLYLQYSQPESGRMLLASSSRDRLIHIFDASRITYDLLQTLGRDFSLYSQNFTVTHKLKLNLTILMLLIKVFANVNVYLDLYVVLKLFSQNTILKKKLKFFYG